MQDVTNISNPQYWVRIKVIHGRLEAATNVDGTFSDNPHNAHKYSEKHLDGGLFMRYDLFVQHYIDIITRERYHMARVLNAHTETLEAAEKLLL